MLNKEFVTVYATWLICSHVSVTKEVLYPLTFFSPTIIETIPTVRVAA